MRQYARFQLRRGTHSQLAAAQADSLSRLRDGELGYATDTRQLFVGDSAYLAQPVQTLDMAVVDRISASVVIDRAGGTIIYKY